MKGKNMKNESMRDMMIRICEENNTLDKTIVGCHITGNKPNVELYCQDGRFRACLDAGTECVFVYRDEKTNNIEWCNAFAEGDSPEEALLKLDELCKYIRSKYDVIVVDWKEFFHL